MFITNPQYDYGLFCSFSLFISSLLGVVLDTKLSFESHIRSIAAFSSSELGIMRKALCLLDDPVSVSRCFRASCIQC